MDKKCNNVLTEKRVVENESPSKLFEENSSDMDDIEEKMSRRRSTKETKSTVSRRPVRKRTRPKNEDFEYDLSNLLKMEAQGYRDSQLTVAITKSNQSKKKIQMEIQVNYENANKECFGALDTLSKKAVENSSAHMKILSFTSINYMQKEQRPSNIFVRPMLPKVPRSEKTSPKKDLTDDSKESNISNRKTPEAKVSPTKDSDSDIKIKSDNSSKPIVEDLNVIPKDEKITLHTDKSKQNPTTNSSETVKPSFNIPAVVPLKFRRQSLDVIKNPILNKNITDLNKAGMKTKILVIKPINRNKDGTQAMTPLKFQTIKLKDPTKGNSSTEEKTSDQVVVVQVPKVECAVALPTIILTNTNSAQMENFKKDGSDSKNNESTCEENKTVIVTNELRHVVESTASESLSTNSDPTYVGKVHLDKPDSPVKSTT